MVFIICQMQNLTALRWLCAPWSAGHVGWRFARHQTVADRSDSPCLMCIHGIEYAYEMVMMMPIDDDD